MVHPTTPNWERKAVIALAVALALLGAVPFFVATTFTGDDHLFMAFSRYVPNPLVAFFRDQHGGEFYRPLPMQLWWALGRLAGGSTWPFATLSWLLHLTVAVETGVLLFAVRRCARIGLISGALFFVAPFTREAAYWYSASTDLLATAFGVASLLAMLRGRTSIAVLLFAGACWSKESAIVIPVLAALLLRAREPELQWSAIAKRVAVFAPIATAYLVSRTMVLHGIGGSADLVAPLGGKLLQIAAGLIHAAPASDVFADPLAWTLGVAAWLALLLGATRPVRLSSHPRLLWAPFVWTLLAVLPLLAASWIVGARYFYMAAIGIAWLAAELLGRSSIVILVAVLALLAGFAVAQTVARRADVVQYRARLSAARRAVAAGIGDGHRTFHIASGIKDIDLAIKEDPQMSPHEGTLVVLSDVPASFVALPETRAREFEFLLAHPPLPPAGAYRFGFHRIVGLARRGDDPTIDEVVDHLPDMRFIRLRLGPGDRIVYRDVTETFRPW